MSHFPLPAIFQYDSLCSMQQRFMSHLHRYEYFGRCKVYVEVKLSVCLTNCTGPDHRMGFVLSAGYERKCGTLIIK